MGLQHEEPFTDAVNVHPRIIGHFARSPMDVASSTAGVPAAEEYATPALRYFLSDDPAISVENDFLHGPLPHSERCKEQQARDDTGVAVPHLWQTDSRTAGAEPYSAVVEEFGPTPAKSGDQPSAVIYQTRRMYTWVMVPSGAAAAQPVPGATPGRNCHGHPLLSG